MAAVKKKEKLLNSFFNLPCFCAIRYGRRKIIVVIIKVLFYLLMLLQGSTDPVPIFFSSQAELLHELEIMKKCQFAESVSGLLHRLNMNRADGLDIPCHCESHIIENVTLAHF